MARSFLAILFFLFTAERLYASNCCGQTPSSYPVLYQHQKLSVTPSVSTIQSLGRVYNGSDDFYVWDDNKRRAVTAWGLSSAYQITDGHQFFVSTGYLETQMTEFAQTGESSHLADTQLGYSYQLVSEYTYSAWKPEVFVSAIVNAPTGRSIYDPNQLSEGASVTGHNQWGFGLGLSVRKVWFPFTVTSQLKLIQLLPKNFGNNRVSDFYDASWASFVTYATPWWGLSMTGGIVWTFMSPRDVSFLSSSSGNTEASAVAVSIQKTVSDEWSVALAVSDQTLIGTPQNTLLNRVYSFTLNYNYF